MLRPRAAFSRPRILPALTTNQNAGFVTVPSENKIKGFNWDFKWLQRHSSLHDQVASSTQLGLQQKMTSLHISLCYPGKIMVFIILCFRLTLVLNWPPYKITPYSHLALCISSLCCTRLISPLTTRFSTCFGDIPLKDVIFWMHQFLFTAERIFKA